MNIDNNHFLERKFTSLSEIELSGLQSPGKTNQQLISIGQSIPSNFETTHTLSLAPTETEFETDNTIDVFIDSGLDFDAEMLLSFLEGDEISASVNKAAKVEKEDVAVHKDSNANKEKVAKAEKEDDAVHKDTDAVYKDTDAAIEETLKDQHEEVKQEKTTKSVEISTKSSTESERIEEEKSKKFIDLKINNFIKNNLSDLDISIKKELESGECKNICYANGMFLYQNEGFIDKLKTNVKSRCNNEDCRVKKIIREEFYKSIENEDLYEIIHGELVKLSKERKQELARAFSNSFVHTFVKDTEEKIKQKATENDLQNGLNKNHSTVKEYSRHNPIEKENLDVIYYKLLKFLIKFSLKTNATEKTKQQDIEEEITNKLIQILINFIMKYIIKKDVINKEINNIEIESMGFKATERKQINQAIKFSAYVKVQLMRALNFKFFDNHQVKKCNLSGN